MSEQHNTAWLLSCGHTAPMLEHERSELPARPRICSTCDRLREVEAPAASGKLVCAQCGLVSGSGRGFRATVVPDYVATIPFERGAREILAWYDEDPARQRVDARLDAVLDQLVERHRIR